MKENNIKLVTIFLFAMWFILFVLGNIIHYTDPPTCFTSKGLDFFLIFACDHVDESEYACEECGIPFEGESIMKERGDACEALKDISPFKCTKYRKKTPKELEMKYCDDNPDDEERCVCEDYEQIRKVNFSSVENSCVGVHINNSTQSIKMCFEFGGEYDYIEVDGKRIEHEDTTHLYYYEDGDCLKARPKTECEKGNDNYVREFVPFNEAYGESCEIKYNETHCLFCREKTPAETLMYKSCEELFSDILTYCSIPRFIDTNKPFIKNSRCENNKEAWRMKGCDI